MNESQMQSGVETESSVLSKFAAIGPAAILAAATMGPGTISSCIMGGAYLNYQLIWVVAISGFLGAVVSLVGGRVFAVTGKAGFAIVKEYTHPFFAYPLFAWTAFALYFVITVMGNFLAHVTELLFPFAAAYNKTVVVPAIALTIATIFTCGFKRIVAFCSLLSAGMAVIFLVNIFMADVVWTDLGSGLIPSLPEDNDGLMIFAGILGGSCPGLSAIGYSYLVKNKGWNQPNYIRQMTIDQACFMGILFSLFSIGIYVAGAAVLHKNGILVNSAVDAAKGIEPLMGTMAKTIFLSGIFMAACLSLGGMSTLICYVLMDVFGKSTDMDDGLYKKMVFCSILFAALGPFLTHLPAMKYMMFAMVVLLLIGPVVIGIYIFVSNKKEVMGSYRSGIVFNLLVGLVFFLNCFGFVAAFTK